MKLGVIIMIKKSLISGVNNKQEGLVAGVDLQCFIFGGHITNDVRFKIHLDGLVIANDGCWESRWKAADLI